MSAERQHPNDSLPAELVELAVHITTVLEQAYGSDIRMVLAFAYRDGPDHTCVRRLANCDFPTALRLFKHAASMPPNNVQTREFS